MMPRSRHISEEDFEAMQQKVRGGVEGHANASATASYGKDRGGSRRTTALAQPVSSPAPSPYKNKWEETFAYGLVLEHRTGLIQAWGYEVMTLRLAKGKYHRPDFTIWHLDGSIEQAAVKGYHKNLRDSLTHIKWACKEHPWFVFTLNRRDGSAWSKELVEV